MSKTLPIIFFFSFNLLALLKFQGINYIIGVIALFYFIYSVKNTTKMFLEPEILEIDNLNFKTTKNRKIYNNYKEKLESLGFIFDSIYKVKPSSKFTAYFVNFLNHDKTTLSTILVANLKNIENIYFNFYTQFENGLLLEHSTSKYPSHQEKLIFFYRNHTISKLFHSHQKILSLINEEKKIFSNLGNLIKESLEEDVNYLLKNKLYYKKDEFAIPTIKYIFSIIKKMVGIEMLLVHFGIKKTNNEKLLKPYITEEFAHYKNGKLIFNKKYEDNLKSYKIDVGDLIHKEENYIENFQKNEKKNDNLENLFKFNQAFIDNNIELVPDNFKMINNNNEIVVEINFKEMGYIHIISVLAFTVIGYRISCNFWNLNFRDFNFGLPFLFFFFSGFIAKQFSYKKVSFFKLKRETLESEGNIIYNKTIDNNGLEIKDRKIYVLNEDLFIFSENIEDKDLEFFKNLIIEWVKYSKEPLFHSEK